MIDPWPVILSARKVSITRLPKPILHFYLWQTLLIVVVLMQYSIASHISYGSTVW
jgi:hypothetical protein